MADYYEYTGGRYYTALERSVKVYKWKLELLDYQDGTIREIVVDLDSSNSGSINFSNAQGTCRSCNITFTNPDYKYSIIENNPFWDRRRFKLYIGLVDGATTYWFAKGVYVTQKATVDYHSISIQAVDKYGLLDGTLNVSPIFLKTKFEAGSKIGDIIRQILLQDIGNGVMLDATEPIIDPDIGNWRLYKEFEMSVGSYYGAFLEELMNYYGCDIYYDNFGRLIVNRKFNDDLPYWNFHIGPSYTFSDKKQYYQDPTNDYDFDGVNYVTVQNEDTDETSSVSYTAINHNPQSPVCVEKVGYKAYDNGNPITISTGDIFIDTPKRKCREYAEYVLLQQTCNTINKSFSCPIIPHLDTRQTIRVSDDPMIEDGVLMVITSITFPFGVPNDMSISAANVQWLLTDTESTSLTCEVGARSLPQYTISYDGTVKKANGSDYTFEDITDYVGSSIVLPSSGANYNGYDLGYFNTDKIFNGWRDNQVGNYHNAGSLYTIPEQNVEMTPNWVNAQKAVIIVNHTSAGTYDIYSPECTGLRTPEIVYWKNLSKYSNRVYTSGDTVSPIYSYTQTTAGNFEIDFLYPPNYETALWGLDAQAYDGGKVTSIDLSGLTVMTSLEQKVSGASNLETFVFPPNLTSIETLGLLSGCPKLNSITFPATNCVIDDNSFLDNSGGTNIADTFTLPSNITIKGTSFLFRCNIGKSLIINGNLELIGQPFTFYVWTMVEHLELNGNLHFVNIDTYHANSLESIVIGANVQIDTYMGFGGGKSFNVQISSEYLTSLSGALNGYSGTSVIIDTPTLLTIQGCLNGTVVETFECPTNLQTISSSFLSAAIRSITFNNQLTTISSSFNGCNYLNNVSLPASVTSLSNSFMSCPLLTTMEILNPTLDLSNLVVGNLTKIRGYAGSTAETYANDHNITFEAIT